jgi:hypothetical protein
MPMHACPLWLGRRAALTGCAVRDEAGKHQGDARVAAEPYVFVLNATFLVCLCVYRV